MKYITLVKITSLKNKDSTICIPITHLYISPLCVCVCVYLHTKHISCYSFIFDKIISIYCDIFPQPNYGECLPN